MDLKAIAQTIKNSLSVIRPPANIIPAILLVCSLIKRPGLSVLLSTAKIIQKMESKGIPMTEEMKTFTAEVVTEIFRAMREDSNIQVAMKPGSVMVTGTVQTAAGPGTFTGFNPNFVGNGGAMAQIQ